MSRLLVSVILLVAVAAAAQDGGEVARLRGRLVRRPDDASIRCQLAFALDEAAMEASPPDEAMLREAESLASESIERGRFDTDRGRRTLGACLYNRGLASERLGETSSAVRDYVDSLAARDNATVRARLDALVPGVPTDVPDAALVPFAFDGIELAETPAVAIEVDGETVHLVGAQRVGVVGGTFYLFALHRGSDDVDVLLVDSWPVIEPATARVVSSDRVSSDVGEVGIVRIEVGSEGRCEEGPVVALDHTVSIFLAASADVLLARAVVTDETSCERTIRTTMRRDGDQLIVERSTGDTLAPGTYSLEELVTPVGDDS